MVATASSRQLWHQRRQQQHQEEVALAWLGAIHEAGWSMACSRSRRRPRATCPHGGAPTDLQPMGTRHGVVCSSRVVVRICRGTGAGCVDAWVWPARVNVAPALVCLGQHTGEALATERGCYSAWWDAVRGEAGYGAWQLECERLCFDEEKRRVLTAAGLGVECMHAPAFR